MAKRPSKAETVTFIRGVWGPLCEHLSVGLSAMSRTITETRKYDHVYDSVYTTNSAQDYYRDVQRVMYSNVVRAIGQVLCEIWGSAVCRRVLSTVVAVWNNMDALIALFVAYSMRI